MAQCYHDESDLKSDIDIDVAKEDEILQEGHDLNMLACKKNPGHFGFIPFKDLKLQDIPREDRKQEMLENIKGWGDCVVRLTIDMKNGSKWSGSGWLVKERNTYQIKTNNHVIKTADQVKHCTVEFHYDDDSRSNVKISTGMELKYTNALRDITTFSFKPVPKFVNELDVQIPNPSLPYLVILYENSHIETDRTCPHCMSSQRYYFTSIDLNDSKILNLSVTLLDSSIGYLKSSYFKFKPIPSNIQELTRIEIHIDGNSRELQGEFVKFGDDTVVKILEPIFQDEVKKCRLVWNGLDICGTRLYFKPMKSREFFKNVNGIDFEDLENYFSSNIWLFDFDPQPRVEKTNNYEYTELADKHIMCCISHPHGSMQMVSFGPNLFGTSLERFGVHGRPREECMCQVPSIKYTCATCPGSSGSPVFFPDTSYDMGSAVTHVKGERMIALLPNKVFNTRDINHIVGKRVKLLLPDSELINTNLNTGWG